MFCAIITEPSAAVKFAVLLADCFQAMWIHGAYCKYVDKEGLMEYTQIGQGQQEEGQRVRAGCGVRAVSLMRSLS